MTRGFATVKLGMSCHYVVLFFVMTVWLAFEPNSKTKGLIIRPLQLFSARHRDYNNSEFLNLKEALLDSGKKTQVPFQDVEYFESRQNKNSQYFTDGFYPIGGYPRALPQKTGPGSPNGGSDDDLSARANPVSTIEEAFCDFGPLPQASLCEWQDGCGMLKWQQGSGMHANWQGGPLADATAGGPDGGYAFMETSHLITVLGLNPYAGTIKPNGLLHSPQLGSTGVAGTCLTFKFAFDGLSSAGLRVHLHAGRDEFSSTITKDNTTSPFTMSCERPASVIPTTYAQKEQRILWNAHYQVLGNWQQAQILYTFPGIHSLILEGLAIDADDPLRSYRGYIAIDDIDLQPGTSCVGFCNFASGFCDWANDVEDDFDWSISRGSSHPTTGPTTDRDKSLSHGGYAYIDSGFPRKPGDVARIISANFPATATDSPMCLHFSFHMFGSGVGELKVSLKHFRNLDANFQEIWSLRGNAGNSWFDSRVTVSSIDDFQLVFEASVGNTAAGDIAIDDISYTIGACPTSPQVAAPLFAPHDCSFEIDECGWINGRESTTFVIPNSSIRTRVDWERVSQQTLNPRNYRKLFTQAGTRPRQEFFMALQSKSNIPGSSTTAYLVSPEIKGSTDPMCISFWYLMFESFIDAAGPSLGILRVYVQAVGETPESATPIWQLYNNQAPTWNYGQTSINEKRNFNILFEGTWGPNRATGNIAIDDIAFYAGNCTIRPTAAMVRSQDCSFEKGLCGWENVTSGGTNDPRIQWQRAFQNHRPAQILDKTFGSPGDYVFFDIFSPSQKRNVRLRSPLIHPFSEEGQTCFTFWFVAFGVEESTSLKVFKHNVVIDPNEPPDNGQSAEDEMVWSVSAKGFNNLRPSWSWAQVSVESRSPYQLILEGSATNGGFAVDDIKFEAQACPTRPSSAVPHTPPSSGL